MYYKHSGRFTLGGLLLGLLAGGASAPLLAYAYAHGLILIPDTHLAALATIAFGALVGLAVGGGLVWGKVRNQPVTWAAAGVLSTVALYLSWAMWVPTVLESEHLEGVHWLALAQHPRALWHMISVINQYGTWSTDNGPATKGMELWVIWAAEAVGVIGSAVLVAYELMNYRPFCETCENWCSGSATLLLAVPQNVPQLKRQLEANDLRPLEALGPGLKGGSHLKIKSNSCDRCRQFDTISVTHCVVTQNRWRQTRITNRKIIQHLAVKAGQVETLRHLSEKIAQAQKISAPKVNASAAGKP